MEYSSEVVRRFDSPRRAGELPHGTPGLVAGEAEDRTLHVWVRFQLQVIDGAIQAARFAAFGCPHTVAAASLVAEWLEGRPVERRGAARRARAASRARRAGGEARQAFADRGCGGRVPARTRQGRERRTTEL